MSTPAPLTARSLTGAGFFLGFALGGFFDGILLHQILQWHHLLSNVDAVQDLRWQIMADGLFHALMYVIAAAALYRLWRRRGALDAQAAGRVLGGMALVGFGAWHMIDAVASHWLLGIHRIKVDSPQPLLWDLAWFAGFGVLPALAGAWLQRRGPGAGSGPSQRERQRGRQRGRQAAAGLGLAALVAGPMAALPAGNTDQVTVLFAPGVTPAQAFDALARVDARVLWVDGGGGTWAVSLDESQAAWPLYRDGAMLVSRSAIALGCMSWLRSAPIARQAAARPNSG